MLSNNDRKAILELMHRQVVPAIGCTEPIAVALCAAKAKELLGQKPERIDVRLSANVLKNAMGVGIPGTGMIGLPIAIALGVLIGDSEKQLEVLKGCTPQSVQQGKEMIAKNCIDIKLEEEDEDKLFINITCTSDNEVAEARIKGSHTNFVYLRKNDKVLLDKAACSAETVAKTDVELSMREEYEFATESPLEELQFILEAK